MPHFKDENELMKFAENFIEERIASLEKDVACCLQGKAVFPALLYCFSTIDLLGALNAGCATKKSHTAQQSAVYMRCFMNYTEEQSRILQSLFRHKIVHLAQPKAVFIDVQRSICWRYWHENPEKHLKLIKLPSGSKVSVTTTWEIPCDYEFNLSITHFVKDLATSVEGTSGYLAILRKEPELQKCFKTAIEQIFDPEE